MTDDNHEEPQVAVCFLFFGLAVGCITTYILSRLAPNFPYAVVVFLTGILCAIGAMLTNFQVLGDSIYQWMNVDPHLLLYIFLPALIFGDAMGLNIHHMKCTFWSGILMGIPGSVLGTFLLAAFSKYILPFGWSWGFCLVFGAILSATDTVAVFALLKQADAPPRLTSLIVQESLYNDGAALVLFNIFFSRLFITYQSDVSPWDVIVGTIRVLFLSPLLGISLGLLTVFVLRLANRKTSSDDVTIQGAVTICCAYLSFFVAEHVLEVSGVLACCTAGITLAWLGPPLILQHETMHGVWSMMEWMGNTLIFLIAGLLFVIKTQRGITTYLNFTGEDFALIFVIYFAVLGSRGIMILVCYPYINSSYGASVTMKECLFLTWCGVRGAVGIVLALVLDESASRGQLTVLHKDAHRAYFLVGGVATLTLVLNATMAKKLLFALGLVEETSEEIRMMQHYARSRIHRRVNELVKQLRKDLPHFDIYLVAEYCKVVAVNSLHRSIHRGSTRGSNNKLKKNQSNVHGRARSLVSSMTSMRPRLGNATATTEGQALIPDERNSNSQGLVDGNILSHTNSYLRATSPIHAHGGTPHYPTSRKTRPELSDAAEEMVRIMSSGNEDENEGGESLKPTGVDSLVNEGGMESVLSHLHAGIGRQNTELDLFDLSLLKPDANNTDPMDTSRMTKLLRQVGEIIAPELDANDRLLIHVRLAFLGVVRMVYWKLIDEGKLPRNSAAALALLYSVDVAQDSANCITGLRDWEALQPALDHTPPGLRVLSILALILDFCISCVMCSICSSTVRDQVSSNDPPLMTDLKEENNDTENSGADASKLKNNSKRKSRKRNKKYDFFSKFVRARLDFRRKENAVYILTSFIEAHIHAQKMVAYYLGEDEVSADTVEQVKALDESAEKVALAKRLLGDIDFETVSFSVSRQVARILLHTQVEMLEQLQKEGILRPRDANELLLETQRDYQNLEGEEFRDIWNSLFDWSDSRRADTCFSLDESGTEN